METKLEETVEEAVTQVEEAATETGKKKINKKNIIFIVIEVILLAAAIGILYLVTYTTSTVKKVDVNQDKIIINEKPAAEETNVTNNTGNKKHKDDKPTYSGTGVRNIALFGVDSRDGNLSKRTRSDTMIVASINQDTHEIKLISLYRDTYLNLGNDKYTKCNAAYAKGGPEQAINMLNMNFDLDITDYVTIGFEGLTEAVDALGGVEIDIAVDEISHLNNYQRSMYLAEDGTGELNEDIIEVYESGLQTLNGLQATAYCRIRYTAGNDYKRAERQRTVIMQLFERAKSSSLTKLSKAVTAIIPNVETSLSADEILGLLASIGEYSVTYSDGIPFENSRYATTLGSDGSCIVPTTLLDNVTALHGELYPDVEYVPSQTVKDISAYIESYSAPYIK